MEQNPQQLIVKESIEINAPATKVWDVLVTPRYIKEWDDVPEGFADEQLRLGSVLEWPGHARLTVVTFEPGRCLSLRLVVASWQPPIPDNIAYTYALAVSGGQTILTITVGDFGQLLDGQDYYDASIEFSQTASRKIKDLAERDFLSRLSAPARSALEHAGIVTVTDLAKQTEREILALHGVGPKSLPVFRQALQEAGLAFAEPVKKRSGS